MTEPRSLARYIRQSYERGDEFRTSAADAKLWLLALHELIKRNALAEATFAARSLSTAFPESLFIRNITMLLQRMPSAVDDRSFSTFANDWSKTLQIVRRNGAKITLLVFCDRHGSLGMPVPVAHRWFGPLQVNVVYLRDPSGTVFATGVSALAEDRAGTVRALTALAARLGTASTVCYGNSSGGTAALFYGLEMKAAAVLAFNASIVAPVHAADRKDGGARVVAFLREIPGLYRNAARRPRAHLVYGASNVDDAVSAQTMAGIPGVTAQAVPDCAGHDAHITLIERGQFGPLLHALIAGQTDGIESGAVR